MKRCKTPADLKKWSTGLDRQRKKTKTRILVCSGPGCLARGSRKIAGAFQKELAARKLDSKVVHKLTETGCHGLCQQGPLVTIMPEHIFYVQVKPKDVPEIIQQTIMKGQVIERLLHTDPGKKEKFQDYRKIPFYARQVRVALRNVGLIDPNDIEEYIAVGGYQALAKVLTGMKPEKVIDMVARSGLRGKGGGGFPTAKKWKSGRDAPGEQTYVICNGDEGDPGAFMDRAIMEGDPHSVIEGMIIGAYAVGSSQGYVYVRQEYPLAVKNMQQAINDARKAGFLGDRIFGTPFCFDIRVSRGGGAFVCGESSALMRSVEGNVGEPRAKYVHSVKRGLFDQPTILNNVETWNNVPYIVSEGPERLASMGTKKSKGTKAFCLVGKVRNTGLIEIPMGTTLREIIYEIGDGIIRDRPFKGVQTGGPSGGVVPDSLLDLPVDFEALTRAGSMMGSGGMIVMDDRTCMVDVAKYFLHFLMEESCGKCVPCREGLKQLHNIVDGITRGNAGNGDLEKIENLSRSIMEGSLCALGKSAPNPVLSTLQYFRPEYETHIEKKKCPAGVCKALITYLINDKCTGCTLCVKACAFDAIVGKKKKLHKILEDKCTRCGACFAVCKFDAIEID